MDSANQSVPGFRIEIVRQGWLADVDPESDLCSHGSIRAWIDGVLVIDDATDYGISQSALLLLRTLDADHTADAPVGGGPLLCHGCGYPIVFGCYVGSDWAVRHDGDTVILSVAGDRPAEVRVPSSEYVDQVALFARSAREFYFTSGPKDVPDEDREMRDSFWTEYDERLDVAVGRRHAT